MRWVMIVLLALCGCFHIDKEAAKLLIDAAQEMSADGEFRLRDPSIKTVWRTDMGVVIELDGLDANGKAAAKIDRIETQPSE